jgi:diphosphomevalonate decarboxylase
MGLSFYAKARVVLDYLRQISGRNTRAQIKTTNNFPTAAGLASSASGLSALALAASAALKLELTKEELSVIARRASGSACRSFWGGYVLWKKGIAENGEDSRGEQIAKETDWPLDVLVLVTCQTEKSNPSTSGMMTTQSTSPSFGTWIKFAEESTLQIRNLVAKKDFLGLAQACEQNCLMMHSTAMTSQPPLIYWHPQTLAVIQKVFDLRSNGYELFFTIDAGPNVVLFIQDKRLDEIKKQFQSLGVLKIIESKVGEGAKILE